MDYSVIDRVAGNRIRIGRLSLSLTQGEVAEKLGIAQPTYSCYEKGTRSIPLDVFDKVCRLLNLDAHAIMQEAADAYAKTFEK